MEYTIGIVSGLIAIITALYAIYKKFKSPNLTSLMNQLVDQKLSQSDHKKILRKINRKLVIDLKHISNEYINNFILNNRGKEVVFKDICKQNNWEITPSLSFQFLGYIKQYNSRNGDVQQSKIDVNQGCHSTKAHTQIVYFSELLRERYPDIWKELEEILSRHNVKYSFLKGTKDIWCRDYMPIQNTSGKLIQFNYDPSYLKGKKEWEESRTDVTMVCEHNGISPIFSDINLDGGNVLLCDGKAIISDRIFSENKNHPNPKWSDKEMLLSELSLLLESEIIIIPSQKGDITGHADGMVRFINKNTILGNDRDKEYKNWSEQMNNVIKEYNLNYKDVPFFTGKGAMGIYVNYLEVNNLIVIPSFQVEGNMDDEVLLLFKTLFPNKTIETINYNEIAKEGGLLNCTTWVVWDDSSLSQEV
ncbi:MAG: agmatine deiminase family protein [Bacteroidales bacterium]|nr:agmatine deiminase family protein [Bacteroidales bacterium]MDD4684623.1 agmatine deiminase family protein [Bacteroidales bacterium]